MQTHQTAEGSFYISKKAAFRDIILSITTISFFFWLFLTNFKSVKESYADILIFAVFGIFALLPLIACFNASSRLILSFKPLFIINKDGFLSNFPKLFFQWKDIEYVVVKIKNFTPKAPTPISSPQLRQLILVTNSKNKTSKVKRAYKTINISYADTDTASLVNSLNEYCGKNKTRTRTFKQAVKAA